MRTMMSKIALAILATSAVAAWNPAMGQSRQAQVNKELSKTKTETDVKTCSLLTNDEIKKVTGRNNSWDLADPPYAAGSVCDFGGVVTIRLYSTANAEASIASTLKNYKVASMQKHPVDGFDSGAYVMYFVPTDKYQDTAAILVANVGARTFMMSLAAPDGKTAESVQPPLLTLGRMVAERLGKL
jgi:hypothetical protein